MRNFFILFKHERKSIFPSIRGRRPDVIGAFLSLLLSLAVIGAFALMAFAVAKNYVNIKVDKILDPQARAEELLCAFYLVIIVALGIMCLEKMRTNLGREVDRKIFLKLPIKHSTLFLSKFAALLVWTYANALFFIIPTNAIFYFVLGLGKDFIVNSLLVYLLLPMAAFLLATVLVFPYIAIIRFLSTKYFLTFITFSGLIVGAFLLYSKFLEALQGLFETSSVKFLFTDLFVKILASLNKYAYPANSLSSIALGRNMSTSLIISGAVAFVSFVLVFIVTRNLYKIALYKSSPARIRKRHGFIRRRSVLSALLRKEFISVFREPKHLFSYFSIAISMPFMVYCCFTLFKTLIYNTIGLTPDFSLAIMVVLVFSILTNTFCATNVTRDGLAALKSKVFPVKASKLMFAKVLFCSIVSSLSVLSSVAVLYFVCKLEAKDSLLIAAIGVVFSLSQIFIATKMDLKHANVTRSVSEIAKNSNRTISKTVTVGMFFALLTGIVSLVLFAFAGTTTPDFLFSIEIKDSYVYIFPSAIAAFYFVISMIYYSVNIEKAFRRLVR